MLRITCRSLRARVPATASVLAPLTATRAASIVYRPGDRIKGQLMFMKGLPSKTPKGKGQATENGKENANAEAEAGAETKAEPRPDKWLDNHVFVLQKRQAVLKALAGHGDLAHNRCRPQKKRTRREYALGITKMDRYDTHNQVSASATVNGDGASRVLLDVQLNNRTHQLEFMYRVDLLGPGSGRPFSVSTSTLWMRDLCPCSQCVTPASGQKAVLTHDLDQHPTVKRLTGLNAAGDVVLVVDPAADPAADPSTTVAPEKNQNSEAPMQEAEAAAHAIATLVITWDDGAPRGSKPGGEHESTFDTADLLLKLAGLYPPTVPALPRRVLWDRALISARQTPVAYADWMATTADGDKTPAFYRALTDLHQLGLVVVDGVPDGAETAVRDIAGAIGHVQPTFYGELFDVVSKPPTEAENVAYTNVHLGLHQDLLYMNDPPRIQLLHCLRNDCAGGESLFSDSLRAAVELQLRFPFYALALSQFKVPYHYERNGNYYFHERPVIELEPRDRDGVVTPADARPVPPVPFQLAPTPFYNVPIRHTAWSPPFQGTLSPVTLMGIRVAAAAAERAAAATSQQETATATVANAAANVQRLSQEEQAQDYRRRFQRGAPHVQLAYWHEAVRVFDDLLNSERNLYEFKLQPGQCVLFDNRRVLHGRRQFSPLDSSAAAAAADSAAADRPPPRWLKGTYVSDQVFRSRVMAMVRSGKAPEGSLPPTLSWTPVKSMLHEQTQVLAMLETENRPLWDDVQMLKTKTEPKPEPEPETETKSKSAA